jgi:RNA-directed DNA polymerase
VKNDDRETVEPMGKLDTLVVNGPEDVTPGWAAVDWRRVEADVRRLRQRIFTASKAGDLKKVRSLQRLMLRSRSNALMSVRRVTEINAGRLTAGIDGRIVLSPKDKRALSEWVQRDGWASDAKPVKRVYVPKADGRKRPLGIPTVIAYGVVVQRVFGFAGRHASVPSASR